MREEGYYWVKYLDEWRVGHWIGYEWFLTEYMGNMRDDNLSEIDENRIVRIPNTACKDDNGIYAN